MAAYRQEMPPKGGYDFVEFTKKQKPTGIRGKWVILGFAAYTCVMLRIQKWSRRKFHTEIELENYDANIALEPLMQAERNRMFLKQLIENREAEAEIMKDVEGWIPGTWYGSPVYHNKSLWMDPTAFEYFAHTRRKPLHDHYLEIDWH